MAVDLKATKGLCQRHWDLGDKLGDGIPRGFLKVSDTVAVKIGATWDAEDLEIEYGWLKYLAPGVDPTKGYGTKASLPLGQARQAHAPRHAVRPWADYSAKP